MTELRDIAVDQLHAHPDNPRLRLRDDVVTQIAAEITRSGFGQEHALLVRPNGDGFEILSGHHRHEAATRCSLDSVPCWVRDMDDDEAFMTLILANTQGELSRIERATHAYQAGERGTRLGRGQKGGLSEYARQLDLAQQRVSEQYAVGELVERYRTSGTFAMLVERDPYSQLIEITKAPAARETLIDCMLGAGWTVADTKRKVSEVKRFDIDAEGNGHWLPMSRVLAAYLTTGRPTPDTVKRLQDTVEGVRDHIDSAGLPEDLRAFEIWLDEHSGAESWDHRAISRYHANLIIEWADRDAETADGRVKVYESRAVDLIQHLDPGSVDLIFTDPPYPVEFVECWSELGELATKALKPGGFLLAYTGQYTMLEAFDRLRDAGLTYFWCHAVQHDGAFFRMNATHVQCGWKPVLVFRNGPGDPPNWHKDIVTDGTREKGEHEWQQSEAEAAYWISELSKPDDLVVDPFVGGGTTAVVCRDLGRRFVGSDVDEKAVQATRERLSDASLA